MKYLNSITAGIILKRQREAKTLKNDGFSACLPLPPPSWASDNMACETIFWAHALPSPPYTNNGNNYHYYCKILLGVLFSKPCFAFLASSSQWGQNESVWIKTVTFHQRVLKFPHRLWTSAWFFCMICTQAFPLMSEEPLFILQMSQLKYLSKCSLNLSHLFSRGRDPDTYPCWSILSCWTALVASNVWLHYSHRLRHVCI